MSINNLKEIQGFFFEMMLAGYASGKEPESFIRFPGHRGAKRISYQETGGWNVTDEWEPTNSGDGSKGTTTIYKDGYPVWEMHYWGEYPKKCIPFLKLAIANNYKKQIWLGGRGPYEFADKDWLYHNSPAGKHSFLNFHGHEFIVNKSLGKKVGWHSYIGGSLFII